MQDISKPKKSLHDIFPGNSPVVNSSKISHGRSSIEVVPTPPRPKKNFGLKLFITVFVVVAIAAICFALSSFYARATIQITPNQGKLFINGTYEASRDGDGLKFVLASNVEGGAGTTVNATGEEDVKSKATGSITVSNNFDTQKQTWVKGTRFETSGLIYRLDQTTSIPGMTKGTDGKMLPGQIMVKVTADKVGDEYNKDQAVFTIPGLKGTTKFDKFSAKVATPITGGFNGKKKKISDADKATALTALKSQIQTDILKKMKPLIPDDYIMFDDGLVIKYTEDAALGQDGLDKNKAVVNLKATATGILFKKQDFSKYFAKIQLKDYKDEDVTIIDLNKFKFTLKDKDTITPENLDKISFNLEGNGHLVWDYDEKDLIAKLQAVKDGNYQTVFSKFPAIKSALIIFRPPWIRSISTDPAKIKIDKIIDTSN